MEAADESKILIIDDDEGSSFLLQHVLRRHGIEHAVAVHDAGRAISHYLDASPDLVIIDLHMPQMDGVELMECLRSHDAKGEFIPIIVMTADLDPDSKKRALESGANDFVDKFAAEFELMLRIKNLLHTRTIHKRLRVQNEDLLDQVESQTAELISSQEEVVQRLAIAAEFRDDLTGRHVERVARMAGSIAARIGMSGEEVELVQKSSKLHDVGKIGIPDAILNKPGLLDTEERKTMQAHTVIGHRILSNGSSQLVRSAQVVARTHHERWDGSGYPDGLGGEEIPIEGRITAIADVFDALVTDRPYKAAVGTGEAKAQIIAEAGKHFDPELVKVFADIPVQGILL